MTFQLCRARDISTWLQQDCRAFLGNLSFRRDRFKVLLYFVSRYRDFLKRIGNIQQRLRSLPFLAI